MISPDEPGKHEKEEKVIETNPVCRKMITIQTEECHFFNMESRWKKVNAACFSVSHHSRTSLWCVSLTLNKEPQGGQQ